MSFKKETYTRERTTIKLTSNDIVAMLVREGVIPENTKSSVKFTVPSGGDWSGMDVDIDEDNEIKVTYETETDSEVEL